MLSDEVKKELEDLFGKEVLDLDRNMLTILALATSQPINNTKLQYVLELHASDITGLLGLLVKKKYLVPTGLGRGTTYTLNRAYVKTAKTKANDKVNDKAKDKAKTKADDGISSDCQENNSVISENKDKANDKVNDKANDKALAIENDKVGLPSVSKSNVDNQGFNFVISDKNDEVKRNKKAIILELKKYCSMWRKISEMARHVAKDPGYISRYIIPELLKAGILVREYPENPKHPGQRYRAVSKN